MNLPLFDKEIVQEIQTMQGFCPACGRFLAITGWTFATHPWVLHGGRCAAFPTSLPAPGTLHGTRIFDSLHCHFAHRQSRPPANDIPESKNDGAEGLLIEGKHLDSKCGFVSLALDSATGEPLAMSKGRDSNRLDAFFNSLNNRQRGDQTLGRRPRQRVQGNSTQTPAWDQGVL